MVGMIIHAADGVHSRALDSNAADAKVDDASKGSSLAARVGTQKNGILDNRHTGHNAHKECNDHIGRDHTGRDRTGHDHEILVANASAEQAETHQKHFLFPQQVDFLSTSV